MCVVIFSDFNRWPKERGVNPVLGDLLATRWMRTQCSPRLCHRSGELRGECWAVVDQGVASVEPALVAQLAASANSTVSDDAGAPLDPLHDAVRRAGNDGGGVSAGGIAVGGLVA